jgi:hypothetical protein
LPEHGTWAEKKKGRMERPAIDAHTLKNLVAAGRNAPKRHSLILPIGLNWSAAYGPAKVLGLPNIQT